MLIEFAPPRLKEGRYTMLSVNSLKPAMPSLKATKVPEKPMVMNALELLAVNEKVFRMLPTAEAVKLDAMPLEVLRLVASSPGLSIMSEMVKSPIIS
jgi:hypothetical protein